MYSVSSNNVLHEVDSIEDGVGLPDKYLVGCLGLAWIGIGGALIKGIKSSGKALYFLAVFPYFVLITLLVRAVSLEGALDGVLYFLAPQWNEILNVKVHRYKISFSLKFFSLRKLNIFFHWIFFISGVVRSDKPSFLFDGNLLRDSYDVWFIQRIYPKCAKVLLRRVTDDYDSKQRSALICLRG